MKHIDLFVRAGAGDEAAFREIFHLFTPRLHPFIYRITKSNVSTEGIIQEVFIKLWLHRQDVAQKEDPSAWLFTVAANLAFNFLRKMSTEKRYINYVKDQVAQSASEPEAEQNLSLKESQAAFFRALGKLPQQRRTIFTMSRLQGLTHKEIAEKLQISPFTVKNQLVAALDFMRRHLHRNDVLLFLFFQVLQNIF